MQIFFNMVLGLFNKSFESIIIVFFWKSCVFLNISYRLSNGDVKGTFSFLQPSSSLFLCFSSKIERTTRPGFFDIYSTYNKYYHFAHIFPVALISVLSLPGLIIFWKSKDLNKRYLLIYIFLYISIVSIFFILPRY